MPTYVNVQINGEAEQALLKIKIAFNQSFGSERIDMEVVRDADHAVIGAVLTFADTIPAAQVSNFVRLLRNQSRRPGEMTVIDGAGSAAGEVGTDFEDGLGALLTRGTVSAVGSEPKGPVILATIGGVAAAHDLSTTPLSLGAGSIVPGSVVITVDVDGGAPETITDDGAGVLTGTTGSLPGDGTIDYETGEMTGTTVALTAASDVGAAWTEDSGDDDSSGAAVASGGAAGTSSISTLPQSSPGALPSVLRWSFSFRFPADFALNNNAVVGAQQLTLDAKLYGLYGGPEVTILRWTVATHDAVAPAAWGTPAFFGAKPAEAPTGALALPIDGTWGSVEFDLMSARVLRVSMNGANEDFTFPKDVLVPSKVELACTWGAALDREFGVDNWNLEFELPAAPLLV